MFGLAGFLACFRAGIFLHAPALATDREDSLDPTERVIASTREWIAQVVVGLGLCPFAAGPLGEGRVRFCVSAARTEAGLAQDLTDELRRLAREPVSQLETTLLVHPEVLLDFGHYNQFLDAADRLLEQLALVGQIQIASFHPHYRFAGVDEDDVANATNRSPYPMLHLLREASVSNAVDTHPDVTEIPERNARRLRELGAAGLAALLRLPGRPPA